MSEPMNPTLPPTKLFRQFCRHEDGWTDHYGALQTAATYAELALPTRYIVHGLWQHGCFAPWEAATPGALVFNAPGAQARPVLVARQEEAEFLIAHGYGQARAVGMPILYTPASGLPRTPRSLLVMPTHTLIGDKYPDRAAFNRYADEVRELAKDFDHVTVCIHPSCRRNGLWFPEFTERGFTIVLGAQTNDANALHRMRALFEQFETVTTNGWGSHVAYALAFGAKVAIHGTKPIVTEENLLRDLAWSVDAQSLKLALAEKCQQQEREFLREFTVPPAAAVANTELGSWLVGRPQQLSPDDMGATLTALVDPSPQRIVVAKASSPGRVLFVSHEASRTGAPMCLLHLLRWLRANTQLDFEVLLAKGGPLQVEFEQLATVHAPTAFAGVPLAQAGFDLIYANTVFCAELIERLGGAGVPLVTHVHELNCGYEWAGARSMAACVRHTKRFIACADVVAISFSRIFGVPADRLTVQHEMVDASTLDAIAARCEARALRAAHGLPPEALLVAACGTLDQRKGADLFIQLAAQLKQLNATGRPVHFLWIGAATVRGLPTLLREDVRKLGLNGEVHLIGEMADPHPLLSLCDVFCLTSREDPFPLTMLEAAALGKPVVCFDGAGGGREFCDAGGGITVPYLDVAAMAAACGDLLANEPKRLALGSAAAKRVKENYSVAIIAPRLWTEIQGLLSQGKRTPLVPVALAEIYANWNLTEAPDRPYIEAHLNRSKIRRQAQALRQAGRNREAVQLLAKEVSVGLASKDPVIICECLIEVAADLAPLDARQAGLLIAKAREVARGTGLNIEGMMSKPPAPVAAAA